MSTSTKMPRPTHLTINPKSATEAPPNSNAPNSSPVHFEGVDLSSLGGEFPAPSTTLTSLPPLPSSPPTSPRHHRDPSKGILRSLRNRSQPDHEARGRGRQIKQVKGEGENALQGSSSVAQMYKLQHRNGSTPELSLIGSADNVNGKVPADGTNAQSSETRPPPASHHGEDGSTKRKDKGPFRNPLGRSKSIRRDSQSKTQAEKPVLEAPPKTAPLPPDRKEEMQRLKSAKDKRGRSAERPVHRDSDEGAQLRQAKDKDKKEHGFVTAGKNVASRTSKAGGNFLTRLGKIGRSSSNHERDVPDSEYVLKVINQPLVEQTRITRISKDLSSCRDKTEYWMPSLPWRCIDYLNLNCESEGLYRVPGSGPQVKHWQRRFDTELDLDLLSEPDLFDPNNIGSMLKAWLRDLPTEIMPSALQNSLAAELEKENADYAKMGQPAPQRLRDALSELSPFKYYLLFAITCHLSLLLSHKDKNRMDLNNLCICIGPCLKLERWLFNYLVGDWRHCWQGCFTEKEYLEAERAHEQGLQYNLPASKSSVNLSQQMSGEGGEERAVYSSASSEPGRADDARPSTQSDDHAHAQQQKRRGEDSAPETYRPTASREQSSGKSPATRGVATAQTASGEARRPSTAEGGGEGTPANQKTPRPKGQQHSRSKSDVATTPTRGGEEEVGFPPVPTGRRE